VVARNGLNALKKVDMAMGGSLNLNIFSNITATFRPYYMFMGTDTETVGLLVDEIPIAMYCM
jgi:hypothetical protein